MGMKFLVLVPAVLLGACTTQQFYGTSDPQIIARKRAELDAYLMQTQTQSQQSLLMAQQVLQQQQAATAAAMNQDPGFTRQEPDGKWVFCQRLGGAAIACRPM